MAVDAVYVRVVPSGWDDLARRLVATSESLPVQHEGIAETMRQEIDACLSAVLEERSV